MSFDPAGIFGSPVGGVSYLIGCYGVESIPART